MKKHLDPGKVRDLSLLPRDQTISESIPASHLMFTNC